MASAIKSALPSRLKPGDGTDENDSERHHGKTRSHMVSFPILFTLRPSAFYGLFKDCLIA